MIINTSQGDIEVVGDVKEFKTSIDPKNLEFITTLLSSNLYSDPEQSFIREIVSNAWDSHVEAGTTNIPVIIKFSKENYLYNITIRDYGVGLSPKRFQEVYCNIGSSTKRESNEFIGGFGIGKYSSLACSNTVYITSYYEGIAYYYVMVKSGNSITTNLLMQKPTTEKNGVEVTIKSITNIRPYFKALDYIIFFPNIYVDGINDADRINTAKLRRFKNFAAASIKTDSRLLLGNVLYPVNQSLLSQDSRDFLYRLNSSGIVIKFDVGEINITPNRESIIYNSETVKKIDARIVDARDELYALIDAKLAKDYDDIKEYADMMSEAKYYNPITDEIDNYSYDNPGFRFMPGDFPKTKITFRGHSFLKTHLSLLSALLSATLPNYKGVICDDKIYTKEPPYRLSTYIRLYSQKILILNSKARLVEAAKLYLRENYNGYAVMTKIDYQDFNDWCKEKFKSIMLGDSMDDVIIQGIYDRLKKVAKTLDLNTDIDYLNFKAKVSTSKTTIPVKEAILYIWNEQGWRNKKHFKRLSEALDYIKSQKKGVVLVNMDADTDFLNKLTQLKGYILIQARKDIVADIKSLNLSCLVDLNWLTHKDPLISKVKAALFHFPEGIDVSAVKEICDNLTREEGDEFLKIVRLRNTFGNNYYYKGVVNNANVKCDPYTSYMCQRLKNYLLKHIEAKNLVYQSGLNSSILTTAAVIKTKAYRVSNKAYQRVQNNKLLRILCKK